MPLAESGTAARPRRRCGAGRGSYGSVYKARVRATGAAVAVKVIPAGAPEEVAAIQREIEMLKQCNHPNVVRYLARSAWGLVVHAQPSMRHPCEHGISP